ncbi:SAM-dependent methyltransferase [Amycolatopsis sp. GM8]|uniref:SAM-dependent methyltransferase n=1 Tax=Amycolatopsis sp. GM8 TaxID=2896530 RepID=UPI001F1F7B03|nr:SAM-dependent methyltransferase [Amycolatopsis sp. GM8]
MNEREEKLIPPEGIDLEHPTAARVYDWLLGGKANWAIDREFGARIVAKFPLLRDISLANRLFLHRAVRHLIGLGVRQFIDIGAGIPTMGNTHQVADELDQETRVVYIDNEPVAVAHSKLLLENEGDPARHTAIHADLREPDQLWDEVLRADVIDFDQPVALLLVAVLHFQQLRRGTDIGPLSVARLRDLLPSGSYLVISHTTYEGVPPTQHQNLVDLDKLYQSSANPVHWRPQQEIRDLFGDFELMEPGLTWTTLWHPEDSSPQSPDIRFDKPEESVILSGVGRKP